MAEGRFIRPRRTGGSAPSALGHGALNSRAQFNRLRQVIQAHAGGGKVSKRPVFDPRGYPVLTPAEAEQAAQDYDTRRTSPDIASPNPFDHIEPAPQRFGDGGLVEAALGMLRKARPLVRPANDYYPTIWNDPRELVELARQSVSPEDPALERLFGVSRRDLYDRFAGRTGNVPGESLIPLPKNPRGSVPVEHIATPGNQQRLIDLLTEASKVPELQPSRAWYALDPLHERLTELHGGDLA